MAGSGKEVNKGTLQYLVGAHLDRISETLTNASSDAGALDQELMWLDVLAYPITSLDDEFRKRMQELHAQERPPDVDVKLWKAKQRYGEYRLYVASLFFNHVLRPADVPFDDVSGWES